MQSLPPLSIWLTVWLTTIFGIFQKKVLNKDSRNDWEVDIYLTIVTTRYHGAVVMYAVVCLTLMNGRLELQSFHPHTQGKESIENFQF